MNNKSDIYAKKTYLNELVKQGYTDAQIISSPADIRASLNGELFFFEMKMTRKKNKYFGAATITEWKQALLDPEHYRFIVAAQSDDTESFRFIEYTPEEFLCFSSIPPFKVYFKVDLDKPKDIISPKLDKNTLFKAIDLYDELKNSIY